MKRLFTMVGLLLLSVAIVHAETYTIDPMHSSVQFKIKHVIGKVVGHFDKFTGTFSYEEGKPQSWTAQAAIEPASVNTGIDKRDTHLRSPDFFEVTKYTTLTFKSTGVTDVQGNTAKLHGDLTIHGVTKPVILDLVIEGLAKDPMSKTGKMRAGAEATGHIDRSDFNVGPSTGALAGMVAHDVEITIDVEGVQQ